MESIQLTNKNTKLSNLKKNRLNYWERMLNQCEKRKAELEQRQAALAKRVKLMECALPSLLIGAVIGSSNSNDEKSEPKSLTELRNRYALI